jgi:hypothetical protein
MFGLGDAFRDLLAQIAALFGVAPDSRAPSSEDFEEVERAAEDVRQMGVGAFSGGGMGPGGAAGNGAYLSDHTHT